MTKRFGNGTGLFKNGIGCTICKTIVTFITWEVKTVNASLETVEKAVKAMCALYPIKIATEVVSILKHGRISERHVYW